MPANKNTSINSIKCNELNGMIEKVKSIKSFSLKHTMVLFKAATVEEKKVFFYDSKY